MINRFILLLAACFMLTYMSCQKKNTYDGTYNVLDYGAKGDSINDDTQAFLNAIDDATKTGGIVLVPPGKYWVNQTLTLSGITLKGTNEAIRSWFPLNGTVLMIKMGKGDENGPPLIKMSNASAVAGITFFYPEQHVDSITPYPYTIQIGEYKQEDGEIFDCTVKDVTLINSYNGIHSGPGENGRHRIYNVNGCVLRRGIFVESVGDVGRIENVHFHCHYWTDRIKGGNFWKAFAYMQKNLEAFIIGRSDWEYMTNTFVFPARIGYRFMETNNNRRWRGGPNGQFLGIAADACGCCVLVEGIQQMGLLITNGQFNAHLTGDSTQIIIGEKCDGNVRFVNCGFWGPVKHNVLIKGKGTTSFTDCYFSSNYYNPDFYTIVAESGKLQVQNCTFDGMNSQKDESRNWAYEGRKTMPPCIYIGKNVQHAIIRGNNGFWGVSIKNLAGNKAIISDNEPVHERR